MKRSPSRYITTPKMGKNTQKSPKSASVEFSTAVVPIKVDIKVIKASLTENQCLQCVTPSIMHVEIP